jgi:hypothetical protein
MSEWNIKVEMNQICCKHLISRYYNGIEAETLEQAEDIAYHMFIEMLENNIVIREFITEPYWMDITPKDYKEINKEKL